MGYRSEVTYAIEFKDVDTKIKFVALRKLNPRFSEALGECLEVDSDLLNIIFEHRYIKWDVGYEGVRNHMDMLREIEEEEMEGVAAKFVRIGEEADDVEEIIYQGDQDNNPYGEEIPIEAEVVSRIIDNLPRSKQPVTIS
jgi:hypothetical protein